MPQEHHVLRCVSCETFQAHIVKKSKKWECKICGTKQSVKRNYGKGSGKECRVQVMKLNEMRMQQDEPPDIEQMDEDDELIASAFDDFSESFNEPLKTVTEPARTQLKSKWTEFLDKIEETNEDEPEVEDDFTWQVNCNIISKGNKRKKKKNDFTINKKFVKDENFKIEPSENYIENSENYNIDECSVNSKKFESNKRKHENVNSKWINYFDYGDDLDEMEGPKAKKVLMTFNKFIDENWDEEVLDL